MTQSTALATFQAQLLSESLRGLFGEFNDEILAALTPMLEWMEVPGGEVVVQQGGTDSDLYFIISGRLRAYGGVGPQRRFVRPAPSEGPQRRFLGDMTRGETIGEVAFFTGAVRTATVVAIRDSLLVRITRPNLEILLADYPRVTLNMARLVITRLNRAYSARQPRPPVNICLMPISAGVDANSFGAKMATRCPRDVTALLLTPEAIGSRLGIPGIANVTRAEVDHYLLLSKTLDELESSYSMVIYVPDDDLESEWSQRCLRMADRVLLLAEATAPPVISPVEASHLIGAGKLTEAGQVLVLLHAQAATWPSQTAAWLNRRPVSGHLHIRPDLDGDMARLARIQSGHAIGLVFSGGGARCFAHLGVYKALQEFGIEIDYVGGTSIGAVMAMMAALDKPADEIIAYSREVFASNPTGDISLLPLTSLIKGRQLKAALDEITQHLVGKDACIEDTWKTLFCVASNYSQASEMALKRGNLAKSVRASCAIPGLLPPVPINGDLLVDGGAFNNFPVNVMVAIGAAKIVGVNISRDLNPEFELDEVPGNWTLISDKLTGNRRKYRLPSLMQILMNTTTLYSASREHVAEAITDLNIKLNLRSVGLLEWHKFEYAVNVGYRRARKQLAALTSEQLAAYKSP